MYCPTQHCCTDPTTAVLCILTHMLSSQRMCHALQVGAATSKSVGSKNETTWRASCWERGRREEGREGGIGREDGIETGRSRNRREGRREE